jgi:hypothetical protein
VHQSTSTPGGSTNELVRCPRPPSHDDHDDHCTGIVVSFFFFFFFFFIASIALCE